MYKFKKISSFHLPKLMCLSHLEEIKESMIEEGDDL